MKLLFIFSFLTCYSFHQIDGQETSNQLPVFTLSFRTLALEKGEYADMYIQSDSEDEPTPVFFNRYRRSGSVSYTGTSPLVFFKMEKAPDPEIPPRRIPVAVFNITESTPRSDLLLLMRPNPSTEPNQPEFLVSEMDDSREAFPQNSVIYINLTSLDLVGTVNKKRADFPRGVSQPFSLTPTLNTAILYDNEQDIHFLFENSFEFQKDSRVLLVLQPPKRRGSLRIRCRHIVDSSRPAPTPTPVPVD